jgi:pilus assembly protein Flp/PilA
MILRLSGQKKFRKKECAMKDLKEKVCKFMKDEEGATAIEYGIMIALISAALIAVVSSIGGKLLAAFTAVDTAL